MPHNFQDTALAFLAIGTNRNYRRIGFHFAASDAADTNNPQKAAVVQLRDLHLERAIHIH